MTLSQQDWQIRTHIYADWVNQGQPPTLSNLATKFESTAEDIQQALERLDAAHHIFLDPDSRQIRMANPLSAIETDYRVKVGKHWLFANCAWDTLGIAAMTGDAVTIEATLAISRELITYQVKSGELIAPTGLLVHFSLPVNQWYDNLIHT